jgi:acetyl/propionyl-CoA carboxylase alpha subunit
MIAKIMTVGPDRATAIDRLARALDETEVTGIQTTLPFHRAVARDPAFRSGETLSTDWVAEHWDGAAVRAAAMSAAADAAAALATVPSTPRVPTSLRTDTSTDGWRAAGRAAAIDRWPR